MTKQKADTQLSKWSLEELFPAGQPDAVDTALAKADEKISAFEKHRAELDARMAQDQFMEIIRELEDITKSLHRLGGFADLWFAEDTQNQKAQTLMARIDQFAAEVTNRVMFFSLWWKSLEDEDARRLKENAGDYTYWLEEMRHLKPYTLSEAEEKVINIKDVTGSGALINLYDAYTNRYEFDLTIEGEQRSITRGELATFVRKSDPAIRASAYQEMYRVYGNDGPILGMMYQTRVRDWKNELIGLRGYQNPVAARNLHNDIPDQVVDTLLEVCRSNSGIFQRYFALKAKALGMKKLRRYDIYAPVSKSERKFSFGRAVELVMDSFNQFDPSFAAMVGKVLSEHHVDSEVRKGKRSGAFCATITPELTPWVLVNYQGEASDVATLAHELGHAIHSLLASQHSVFTQHACLPLAETASTFGEMILIDHLMEEEQDESVKKDLLFRQVDDAYATIMRQAYFALFEKEAHALTSQGAAVDELCGAYMENLADQFGTALDIADEFKWEWVSIPHIYHVPFYVYAYAFGQLLVLSLYKRYKQEGSAFKPEYINILCIGGSKPPVSILSQAGIDVYKPSFWQGGFDVINGLISQLEEIQ